MSPLDLHRWGLAEWQQLSDDDITRLLMICLKPRKPHGWQASR